MSLQRETQERGRPKEKKNKAENNDPKKSKATWHESRKTDTRGRTEEDRCNKKWQCNFPGPFHHSVAQSLMVSTLYPHTHTKPAAQRVYGDNEFS